MPGRAGHAHPAVRHPHHGHQRRLVRGKPTFDTLLPDLRRLIDGAVVVAHNASFDCNFLAQRLQTRRPARGTASRLCTLRLARRLIPGLHSYRLDSLCAFLGFTFVQRHRAGPDAEATLDAAPAPDRRRQSAEASTALTSLLRVQQQPVSRKRHKGRVDEAQVASLPTTPGVYLLKDRHGQVVYVGKSVNVRQRVRTHLRPSGTAREPRPASTASPTAAHRRRRSDRDAGPSSRRCCWNRSWSSATCPRPTACCATTTTIRSSRSTSADPYPRLEATRERPTDGDAVLRTVSSRGRRLVGGGVSERAARLAPVQRAA